jgi:hypothetical protein
VRSGYQRGAAEPLRTVRRVSGRCVAVVASVVACLVGATPAGAASPVSLEASSTEVASGQTVMLDGQADPGATVQLAASLYPYRTVTTVASVTTDSGGGFEFKVRPDRNTRYTATAVAGPASPAIEVDVSGLVITKLTALPLGRAQVVLVVFHPRDLPWGDVPVRWSLESRGASVAGETTSFPLSPSVAVLRTAVALPAGPFRWSACFNPPGAQALLDTRRPPGCAGRGYHGSGSLPAGYPGPAAISRAAAYLTTRTGQTAFAVVDSEGRLSGVRVHETFITASVVKAMLLTAYLRRLDARGQHTVDSYSNSFLYPMIHVSDNTAASQCYSIVGDSGLYAVAGAAHMTDFSVGGNWGTALLSPADQARFFFEMDSLIPTEFVGYARFLLSTIEPSQSWAIPAVARPLGYSVFFKDGSEPTGLGQLVHQVARLEGHARSFSMAVMTDGDPTMQYGIDTIAGVTQALLR